MLKNPSDFVGNVLGQSESNTRAILASSKGKVLIIDEAYMLYSQTGEGGSQNDIYKTAVIDTIVAEVQSVPGDDQSVLLLGYTDEMERMFQNVNPGLSRRFPIASAFVFEDFTDEELSQILDLKLRQQAFAVTNHAKQVAMSVLQRARNRPNFGNAGEVDILLDRAKATHQRRLSKKKTTDPDSLEAEDFDEDFDHGARAVTNCRELFADVIGCENVVAKLEGYQQIALNMKERNLDPKEQIPFNFLFKGPPGDHFVWHLSDYILTLCQAPERLLPRGRWVKYTMIWVFYLLPRLKNALPRILSDNTLVPQGKKSADYWINLWEEFCSWMKHTA